MTPTPLAAALRPLLEAARGPAAAVAAVRGGERAVLCHGPAGEGSRFETGSLTKTFTALLLAELAARGEVRYGDRADRYLPFRLPGPPLTLLHLATHTSGLPRLPPGLLTRAVRSGWLGNPYAGFGEDDLLASLRRTPLRHSPGSRVHYSNFGGGLLGHVLARAAGGAGGDYAALLAERVTGPLGLTDTDCDPNRPQLKGHWHGRPRPALLMPGLTAAGAVRSSARDLLRVLTLLLHPDTARTPCCAPRWPRCSGHGCGCRGPVHGFASSGTSVRARTARCSTTPEGPVASPPSRASSPRRARGWWPSRTRLPPRSRRSSSPPTELCADWVPHPPGRYGPLGYET